MSRVARIATGSLGAAALITGLLGLVQLVRQADSNPRAVALACLFGTGTVVLIAGIVVLRVPRVQALLAAAGAGATAAMVLAGVASFGYLFLLPLLLWLALTLPLCRAGNPSPVTLAAAAIGGLGTVFLALAFIVAAFPKSG